MTLEIAKKYIEKGYFIVPVPNMKKEISIPGWKDLEITNDNVGSYFDQEPGNIALLLGKPGSDLVDLDLDCELAREFAPLFAPKTGFVYGRESNPDSHMIYRCSDDECRTVKFQTPDHGMIAEIRGKDHASLLPGSTHPSGEAYTESKGDDPASVSFQMLYKSVALIASCSLLSLEWPSEGSRQNAALAVAGMLCKAGYPAVDVITAVNWIAAFAGDEEKTKRRQAAEDTVKKFEAGSQVIGITAVRDCFGEKVAQTLSNWLELSEQAEIGELVSSMNSQYAFIIIGGKSRILEFGSEIKSGKPKLSYINLDAFRGLYRNRKICVGSGRNGPIYKSHADVWIDHPDRRTYSDMVFEPGLKVPDNVYNYWQGFSLEPDGSLSCDRFLGHLKEVVCSGDESIYNWFVAWLANMVQDPGNKSGTAIALIGKQGAGKSCIGEYIGEMLGPHYLCINNHRHLLGSFNAHQFGVLFVQADEAFWAGDKGAEGVLKDVITNDYMNIERKGIDVVKARNCMRLMITTNSDWAVPAAMDDRRFLVLEVSDHVAKDHDYFEKLQDEKRNGGPSALLHFLMEYDCEPYNLRQAPQTEALVKQKLETLEPVGRVLYEFLVRGHIHPKGKDWPEYIEAEQFLEICKSETKKSAVTDRSLQTSFGIKLIKYLGKAVEKKKKTMIEICSETGIEFDVQLKVQRTVYELSPLDECREMFTKATGIPFPEEE